MFRNTSENQNFRGRVANHSTKPAANGHVSVLPPSADLTAIQYDIDEQRVRLKERLANLLEKIRLLEIQRMPIMGKFRHDFGLKHKSQFVPTPPELTILNDQIRQLRTEVQLTERELGRLRKAQNKDHRQRYETVFIEMARAVLSEDVFNQLDALTLEQTGQPRPGFLTDYLRNK